MCIKHHIITHRLKILPDSHYYDQRHSTLLSSANRTPSFQPFKLDKGQGLPDADSISHLVNCSDVRPEILDGTEMPAAIRGSGTRHQRGIGGGKRGRPVTTGRRLNGRRRKHIRPTTSNHVTTRRSEEQKLVEERKIVNDASAAVDDDAAQTSTEEIREINGDFTPKSGTVRNHHITKYSSRKEIPFLGSGVKGNNTFSFVGNQQQVMKIINTKFQEWLPLVRSIIYDAGCNDYVKAFQRDLTRQKLSHAEQLRLLQVDLKNCRSDKQRREVRAEIVRFKQQWTREHDRVLANVSYFRVL
ncbi:hypothetical protein Y032_0272g942 [Ancylostoma ceylanicum]|nr:hypothetical protein Y032_0272g942 [Ancylostoma ceylanicum]